MQKLFGMVHLQEDIEIYLVILIQFRIKTKLKILKLLKELIPGTKIDHCIPPEGPKISHDKVKLSFAKISSSLQPQQHFCSAQ